MVHFEQISESVCVHIEGETLDHVALVKLEECTILIENFFIQKICDPCRMGEFICFKINKF